MEVNNLKSIKMNNQKAKVGDTVRVLNNNDHNDFDIGELVVIKSFDNHDAKFAKCHSNKEWWYVHSDNYEIVINPQQRPIEQIINEGKAMLAAKDNEIEFIETSFKNVYNEQERQIKSLSKCVDAHVDLNKTLLNENYKVTESRSEYIGKIFDFENQVRELKDNCNTYVSKIQDQNDRIEVLNKEIDNDNVIIGLIYEKLNLLETSLIVTKRMFVSAVVASSILLITFLLMMFV